MGNSLKLLIILWILVFAYSYPLQSNGNIAGDQSNPNFQYISVGTTQGYLNNEGYSDFYNLNLTKNEYSISLNASVSTNFDLYIYGLQWSILALSAQDTYPETISYQSSQNQTVIVEVRSVKSSGEYTLNITIPENPIYSLGKINGTISNQPAQRVYKIQPGYGFTNIYLENKEDSGYFSMSLMNSSYDVLQTGYSARNSYPSHNITFFSDNDTLYYLEISAIGIYGSFTVHISHIKYEALSEGMNKLTWFSQRTVYYIFDAQRGIYNFTVDYNHSVTYTQLYVGLYDKNMKLISSINRINYFSNGDNILIFTVSSSTYFNIHFDLYINKTSDTLHPDGYKAIDPEIGFDLYEIRNLTDQTFTIQLKMIFSEYYFMILDTNLELSIDSALNSYYWSYLNPHILLNTYDLDFKDLETQTIQFNPLKYQTLYILVYGDSNSDYLISSYKISSSIPLENATVLTDYQSLIPYQKGGGISDNGNYYWENGEFVIYKDFKLQAGEILDIYIKMASFDADGLYILLFDGDDVNDINNALSDIEDYFYYDYPLPSNIYWVDYTYYDNILISYKSTSTLSVNIALFLDTYYSGGDVMYTIYTNIEQSGSTISTVPERVSTPSNPHYNRPQNSYTRESDFKVLSSIMSLFVIEYSIRKRRKTMRN